MAEKTNKNRKRQKTFLDMVHLKEIIGLKTIPE